MSRRGPVNHTFTLSVAIALAFALGGCGLPDRDLKRNVADAEMVGTWTMTARSQGLLKREGFRAAAGQQYVFTLNADGTAVFDSADDGVGGISALAGRGTWTLEHGTKGNETAPKSNALKIDLGTPTAMHRVWLNFDERDGKLVLWTFFGDPDMWEFIEYERTQP